ncbi:hypothetical protein BDV38DRAFT_268166 [Aspergillus pseudotamarii]|uniref:NAD(P)-binding protein n=1 Tax=Aspergillus pseudotamarii TaxID=132259 RepID=A0A5N6T6K0_ASPPS|nr:uncharacterized protein BDV38DRAFT_268166 [Aspergillus pseudotamarii]KAE8141886.1 hypothetical protein BDV38DRAFT_268166 [Aspergillus pseudotamarii]
MKSSTDPASLRVPPQLSLDGRVIIVTGGARGIGLSLSKACLEAGAVVAVTDIQDHPAPEFTLTSAKFPDRLYYYRCDLTNEEELNQTFTRVYNDLNHVEGIITAAGICIDKPFIEHTWEDIRRQQLVNETATFFAVQHVTRKMKELNKKGSIVMVCSQTAQHVSPGHELSGYAGTKGFIWSFARNIAHELSAYGIRVNTISPGYIATDMNLSIAAHRPNLLRIFREAPPLGRVGSPEDLNMAALYLLSDGSSYVTGQDLVVDGGMQVSSGNYKSQL